MNELRIKTAPILREVKVWVWIFLVVCIIHAYAISALDGQWSEMYTQIHVVLIMSVLYYLIVAMLRGFAYMLNHIIQFSRKNYRKLAG